MADPIPESLQLYSIQRAMSASETLRKEFRRLTADDSPRIMRRLARQRIEDALRIMADVGYLSELERRAAVINIERTFVRFYPEDLGW